MSKTKKTRNVRRGYHNRVTTTVYDDASETYKLPNKHPRGLRGKEIGLWYAKRSKETKMKMQQAPSKSMGTIIIPDGRASQIRIFLENLPPIDSMQVSSSNSNFKRRFFDIINTTIDQQLASVKDIQQCEEMNIQLQDSYYEMTSQSYYMQMKLARERLPAYKMQEEILNTINANQIVIISGETGCGKTTQVPQFILDDYLKKGQGSVCKIVCSQPRRISAVSVAERIADERGEPLGRSVGYQIRLESKFPRKLGSILMCTTGCILKQMEGNVGLEGVSHLILDEIHERDVLSDFILALLKQVLRKRTNLKVILMSATLNAEKFAQYFDVTTILTIPGFTYEVQEYYLEDVLLRTGYSFPENQKSFRNRFINKGKSRDFYEMIMPHVRRLEDLKMYPRHVCKELTKEVSEESVIGVALALIIDICEKESEPGAILVFLTGYADISKLHQEMESSGRFPASNYLVLPLHSQMPTAHQRAIFDTPPSGVRKIILSTNIAETSITIDDVVFVIDCGKIKLHDYDVDVNGETLQAYWVSRANARQRRGRAGRVKPGKCFHLFSQARNMLLEDYHKPELLRKRLDDVILMVKLLQLGSAGDFLASCPDPPDVENINSSISFLKRLNALDENEVLTPLGYHLSRLPVGPQMGKMLLLGSIFNCVNPILNIVSALDFKDAFMLPLGKEALCRQRKKKLVGSYPSDHILFHKTMELYEQVNDKSHFCWDNFLSRAIMDQLSKMKLQFGQILCDLNFLPVAHPKAEACNKNSINMSLIKAIIAASLYPNVMLARTKGNKKKYTTFSTLDRKKLEIHTKSVLTPLDTFESPFMVYYRKVRSTQDFVYDASVVHVLPLIFFGDRFKTFEEGNQIFIEVNNTIKFKTNEQTLKIIVDLRNRLNYFLEQKACVPTPVNWDDENEIGVLTAIIDLITVEDEGYDLSDFGE